MARLRCCSVGMATTLATSITQFFHGFPLDLDNAAAWDARRRFRPRRRGLWEIGCYPRQIPPWEGDFGLILGLRGFGAGCIGFRCFR